MSPLLLELLRLRLTTRASAASDSLAHALPYVPPPAIGGWRIKERSQEALVGCMRLLGLKCETTRGQDLIIVAL